MNNKISYQSTRLTFKKDLIEPLGWADEIEITVPGEAIYSMTKREFYNIFPNVVDSRSYQEIGNYNYKQTPNKASRFIKRNLL